MDLHQSLNAESVQAAHLDEPIMVAPETPLSDVLVLLKTNETGTLLVCRRGVLEGIFTERDALKLMAQSADLSVPVGQVMIGEPVTLRSGDSVAKAIHLMAQGGYRRLPIVDDQHRPIGVADVKGLVHFIVQHFPETVYNLPPHPDAVVHQREGA